MRKTATLALAALLASTSAFTVVAQEDAGARFRQHLSSPLLAAPSGSQPPGGGTDDPGEYLSPLVAMTPGKWRVGSPISQIIDVQGRNGRPVEVSVTGLPAWLAFDADLVALTSNQAEGTSASFTVRATDGVSDPADVPMTLTVNPAVVADALDSFTVEAERVSTRDVLTVAGIVGEAQWSWVAGKPAWAELGDGKLVFDNPVLGTYPGLVVRATDTYDDVGDDTPAFTVTVVPRTYTADEAREAVMEMFPLWVANARAINAGGLPGLAQLEAMGLLPAGLSPYPSGTDWQSANGATIPGNGRLEVTLQPAQSRIRINVRSPSVALCVAMTTQSGPYQVWINKPPNFDTAISVNGKLSVSQAETHCKSGVILGLHLPA